MYRKNGKWVPEVDLHIGPTLAVARLEKRSVCTCGMNIVKNDTPVGMSYDVDLKSVRWTKFRCGGCGKEFLMRVIDVWNSFLTPQWFPLACLDLDAGIPYAPLPENWEKVKENMVAPAHYVPGRIV